MQYQTVFIRGFYVSELRQHPYKPKYNEVGGFSHLRTYGLNYEIRSIRRYEGRYSLDSGLVLRPAGKDPETLLRWVLPLRAAAKISWMAVGGNMYASNPKLMETRSVNFEELGYLIVVQEKPI